MGLGDAPQPSPYTANNPNTVVGAMGAVAGPGLASTALTNAQYQQQLGNLGPGLQTAADELGIDTGLSLGQLGITAQQQALQQQGSEQSYALQQQAFQQQAQENQFNYATQLREMMGGQAASGVNLTSAAQYQQGKLGQQAAFAQQNLGRQVTGAAQQQALAQQNFGLLAKSNGISQQEVWNRLSEGLNQMGIQADPSQLVSQLAGGVSSANQQIAGILASAGLLGKVNPNAMFGGGQ